MARIFESRFYQSLIPLTNYLILGVISAIGFVTVFFAYPIMSACITTAIRIYGRGNETVMAKFFHELRRHIVVKTIIGLVTSVMALMFYHVFTKLFAHVMIPIQISLIISLVIYLAAMFYLVLEEYSFRDDFHFNQFFQNSLLDIVIELPTTLLFILIMVVMFVMAIVFPLSVFFSLTILNFVFASFYHKKLSTKLSRF